MARYLVNPLLVLLFFLYPFVSLQLVYSDLNIPLADICAMGLGLIFLWYILGKVLLQQTVPRLCLKGIIAYSLFLLIAMVSISNSPAVSASLKYFLRHPLFYFVSYYIAAGSLFIWAGGKPSQLTQWHHLFCITLFIFALVSVSSSLYRIWRGDFWGILEIPFLTGNHKTIAITVAVSLPLLIGILKNIKGLLRLFYWITILFSVVGVILSVSKAAWLTVIIVFILWETKKSAKFRPFKIAVTLLSLLFLLGVGIGIYLISSAQPEVIRAGLSRSFLGVHALQLFAAHPFIGSGIGNFVLSLEAYTDLLLKLGYPGLIERDAHGLFFKVLSETGIAGVLTFCTFYLAIFRWLYNTYKLHQQAGNIFWENLLYGCLTGLVALFIINSFFGTDTYNARFWFPLMFIVAQGYLAERQGGTDAARN
ncbi:MAG: O-antigen ligase family protein [bacterium]|nr:O-antigen ligase family protein [bacterium]